MSAGHDRPPLGSLSIRSTSGCSVPSAAAVAAAAHADRVAGAGWWGSRQAGWPTGMLRCHCSTEQARRQVREGGRGRSMGQGGAWQQAVKSGGGSATSPREKRSSSTTAWCSSELGFRLAASCGQARGAGWLRRGLTPRGGIATAARTRGSARRLPASQHCHPHPYLAQPLLLRQPLCRGARIGGQRLPRQHDCRQLPLMPLQASQASGQADARTLHVAEG